MISGRDVAALLEQNGIDFTAGVPCSLVGDVIAVLERHPRVPYIAAAREDAAVGLAAGAWFAGRRPAVLMQNSGLGTSLNALASLSLMYGLPLLLLVTWRGYQGKDAPEHILTGEITPRLLDLLGIPHRVLSEASARDDIAWAVHETDARRQPVALVVPPRVVEAGGVGEGSAHGKGADGSIHHSPLAPLPWAEPSPTPPAGAPRLVPTISRREALGVALERLGNEPVVHANGYICRESFSLGDRPQNFYMIGSMGLASAIGLGLALGNPARRSVVFDGDGNLLMNLGILATVAATAPANFVHVVFDNEVYGSTGNQASPSRHVRLDRLAAAAGYRRVAAVTEPGDLDAAIREALATPGPHFVLVKTTADEAEVPRIPYDPPTIRDRFRASLA
ncbi:MAG: phosphonopyruvate decarboxylase [Candidatus Rokubacteria bacterium]|nr:phosphonopyruvate decarboxylase [Candidatus Rokubacteria bacterium]